MLEEWKTIESYGNGHFMVSNLGRVKRIAYDHVDAKGRTIHMKESLIKVHYRDVRGRGYGYVTLCYNNKAKSIAIHVLVARAFIPNPDNKPEVNHEDGNKHNNTVANLSWVTRTENMHHARVNDLLNPVMGAKHHKSKRVEAIHYKSGIKLATFESIHIAEIFCRPNQTSITGSHIKEVCDGKRDYAYGYKWRYCEENCND